MRLLMHIFDIFLISIDYDKKVSQLEENFKEKIERTLKKSSFKRAREPRPAY